MTTTSAGHVFAIRGDLTKLACDAWLLPTDACGKVEEWWLVKEKDGWRLPKCNTSNGMHPIRAQAKDRRGDLEAGMPVKVEGVHAATWSSDRATYPACQPWLVNIAGTGNTTGEPLIADICQVVRAWIEHAARGATAEPPDKPKDRWRERPLLALPLVGTGKGGASKTRPDMVEQLLPCLRRASTANDVDVCLVAHSEADHAAIEAFRRKAMGDFWPGGGQHKDLVDSLYQRAAEGRLVVFAGAGVSCAAGLPGWTDLLAQLEKESTGCAQEWVGDAALANLPVEDRATLLARRLGGELNLQKKVSKAVKPFAHYSMLHGLIASLPVWELITTNYDTLLETALRAVPKREGEQSLAVLPRKPDPNAHRWLLKLHGCVDHSEDIIITRQHYLRYHDSRSALAGIVQAMLMTRHMLFLGFSLTDVNFMHIIDDVRKAMDRTDADEEKTPFGTALFISDVTIAKNIWRGDLRVERIGGDDPLSAARELELVLDEVACKTAGSAHLLDDGYKDLHDRDGDPLRGPLRKLAEAATTKGDSPIARRIRRFLGELGWRDGC